MITVKRVVKVRLLPSPEQKVALEATLRACNAAASWLSEQMYRSRIFRRFEVQQRWYRELLYAVVDEPEAPTQVPVNGFLGVGRGIVNVATTSDGDRASGTRLNRYRTRQPILASS